MPVFPLTHTLEFPHPAYAEPDGLLAVGGDLSVERLLLAYSQGIFPWYSEDSPILWWSPPKRAILRPAELHCSRSLRQILAKKTFEIRFDTAFKEVITACAQMPRPGQSGTWITKAMQQAYIRLYEAGFAHSVEVYQVGQLVGGLYGVSLGRAFFGESMFSHQPNASKVAFAYLAQTLLAWDFELIDCQVLNPHTASLGAYEISRKEFLQCLRQALQEPVRKGKWR